MLLKVGYTGSSGNAYFIDHDGEILLLDAGVGIKEIKQMIDFRVGDISGCIVTHAHQDHVKSADKLSTMGIRVYKPYELETKKLKTMIGGFRVTSFDVPHDRVECRAFIIEVGRKTILYATDFEYIPYKLKSLNLNVMLIECNYQDDLLNAENDHRDHVYRGHSSLCTVADFVAENATDALTDIVLCHASESGALDKHNAVNVIQNIAPETTRVHMAERGLTIEF